LGLLLAAIGLYGLLAYSVARRIPEIGVRLALGATPAHIARRVLLEALALVAAGLALGVPVVFWAKSLAANAINGLPVSNSHPLILSGLTLFAAALLAGYLPARRAAKLDPIAALRQD
jgi:ABC-type antimicrobial peptide transport system permease subunit